MDFSQFTLRLFLEQTKPAMKGITDKVQRVQTENNGCVV
jgi:hypothetical protein